MHAHFKNSIAVAGLLLSMAGMSAAAQAQSAQLINQCDRVCANTPRAICYATCLGGNGPVGQPAKAKRPQPVSVQSSAGADWKSVVYASPSRSGPSGSGGGNGGGKGGK